jgi:hypothetical protein
VTPLLALTALGFVSIAFPQVLGNGKDVVQQALTASPGMGLLGALLPLRLLATAGCLGSGTPGGLFTPTITYGALLGGLLGCFGARVWPGLPVGSCALLGAGAVLAATTQGPVSAVALTLELTQRVDEHCRLVGQISGADAPAAPDESGDPWETATASDLAEPVEALTSSMTAVEVDQHFQQLGMSLLPLVDPGSGRLLGAVANSRDSA